MRWPTTTAKDSEGSGRITATTGNSNPGVTLSDAVNMWPTPDASIEKFRLNGSTQQSNSLEAMARRGELGPLDLGKNPTNGNRRAVLNPSWAEALMGIPPNFSALINTVSIDSAHSETPSSPPALPSRSSNSGRNSSDD